MYCETPQEKELFESLQHHYPNHLPYLLDLLAWVYINKPDRYEEIMSEYREKGENQLIELQDFDIKTILKNSE